MQYNTSAATHPRQSMARRIFISRMSGLAVTGLAGGMIAHTLLSKQTSTEKMVFNDGEIEAGYLTFQSPQGNGEGRGYLVRPLQSDGNLPALLVAHGSSGLNAYIENVAQKLARQGYLVLAPDALHTSGGYPGNDDDGWSLLNAMSRAKVEQDFIMAAKVLKQHDFASGKLGVIGFCFGGYISNMLASLPELIDAAVPFYGMPANDAQADRIKGPLLLQFAETDEWVNGSWGAYEAVLATNQANYQAFVYPGVGYDFHNDSGDRYDKAAAELAWARTLAFFGEHLRG